MFTQRRLGNKKKYAENHQKILTVLKKGGIKGTTVEEMRKESGVYSRRIIYRHLKEFEQKGQVKKQNHRWYWITYWETTEAIQGMLESVASFLNRLDPEGENIKNGVFSENIFVITPETHFNGKKSFSCMYYPLKEFKENPSSLLEDYLRYCEMERTEEQNLANSLREDIKRYYRGPSGEVPPDEAVEEILKRIKVSHIITEKYTKDIP